MKAEDVQFALAHMTGYHGIYVPEFTFAGHRIDAAIIDLQHRWIRGFEIKVNRGDWLRDEKWVLYTRFLSSLSVVCPEGLLQPTEIEKPLGLMWIEPSKPGRFSDYESPPRCHWKKRPGNFQHRNSLAWLWTYVRVLEAEFPRMHLENINMHAQIDRAAEQAKERRRQREMMLSL
jgi:hypothetical protein